MNWYTVILAGIVGIKMCSNLQMFTLTLDQAFIDIAKQDYINISQFRVRKYNRTTFVLNVELETFIDVGKTEFLEIEVFTSRLNNNQYTRSPFRIPRMNVCDFIKGPYATYFMKPMRNVSNFLQFEPNKPVCPWKKARFVNFLCVLSFNFIFFSISNKGKVFHKELCYQWWHPTSIPSNRYV